MKKKWIVAALASLVVVIATGMTLAGCKNNSDDGGDETCVVTYYPNVPKDATGAENLIPQKQTYPLGSKQQFPEDLFSLAGYRIIGWSTDSWASNVYSGYRVGDSFTVHRAIAFYAIWEKKAQITIDGIIYSYETDDEGNNYYEVLKASNTTGITVANIRSEVAGIPVTSIGEGAFNRCYYLTSVSIPNTVTEIGTNAFNRCYNLTSVIITDSVTKIGGGAFSDCSKLTSIAIPDSVEYINYSTFENCSSLTTVSIPNSVTKIGENSFSGCTNLTSVIIPDSVTEIGKNAFYYCTNLTSIEIPCVVAYIRKGAFGRCSNLTEMTLPCYLGNSHFGYIFDYTEDQADNKPSNSFVPQALKKVTITGGELGNGSFEECGYLTNVIIGDGVTSIVGQPFKGCSGLATVEISDGMAASIGSFVFKGCSNLTSVTIGDGNPLYSSQDKILYTKDKTSIICVLETINGVVTIPDSVTSIGYSAFGSCNGITSIMIPDSVTEIGEKAFSNCSSLTNIEMPDSVTEIGTGAFINCSSLASVTIPYSVTSISTGTFSKCTKLKTVIYTGTLAQWCEMEGVSEFMHYAEHVYISDGNDLKNMTELVIPNVVTGIKACSFYGCKNLTSVTIPDSVKYISNSAFDGCRSLTNIEIPSSVMRIGESAFSNCSSLKSIEIPNSVTYIPEGTFENCSKLATVTIPNSVTSIGNGAFRGCSSITEITLPFTGASKNGGSDTYFDYIFGGTESRAGNSSYNSLVPRSLKRVTITGNSIVDYAFRGCTGLTNVTILYGTVTIGMSAFSKCENLASVTIPNSVTGISTMAFYECKALKLINFEGTKEQWKSIQKGSYWDYSTGGITGQVMGSSRGYTVACTDGNI